MLRRSCALLHAGPWRAVPEKKHYDVCVIGGGPAGVAAALRAVDYQKRVCLIERDRIGGCDLWNGALQSKTLWEFSNFMQRLKGPPATRLYGEATDKHVELDEVQMRTSMRQVSETRERQIRQALQAGGVDLLRGQATFQNDHEVQCHMHGERVYQSVSADYFVIATGSTPREHPFVRADGHLVVTSNEVMNQPLPGSLVIIGAGVIGCEFASIFSGFGKTRVSLIDKAPHILPNEDDDVVRLVEKQMERGGVNIHHDCSLYDLQAWEETAAEAEAAHPEDPVPRRGVQYTIIDRHSKKLTTFNVDRALVSIGRVPNYSNLGIRNTSMRTRDGRICVNEMGLCDRTRHIFAVGDAASNMLLVSMGEAQAKNAVNHMYSSRRLRDQGGSAGLARSMSSVAFLTKAVASVGLNESDCRRRNIGYICCRYGLDLVSRAVAAANTEGFIKIIVSNDADLRVLGIRAVGFNASTIVDLGSLAIQNKQTAFDLVDRLTAYPAVSQGFQQCLRAILGRSEVKPGTFDTMTLTRWLPDNFDRGVAYQSEERAASKHRDADTHHANADAPSSAGCSDASAESSKAACDGTGTYVHTPTASAPHREVYLKVKPDSFYDAQASTSATPGAVPSPRNAEPVSPGFFFTKDFQRR